MENRTQPPENAVFDSPGPYRSSSILESEGYSPEQIERIATGWRQPSGSSLDPDEINVRSAPLGPSPEEIEARFKAASDFRHSGWRQFRAKTAVVIQNNFGEARLRRFEDCGNAAWVLKTTGDVTKYRLASNRCRDRFCLPCHQESSRVVLANLRQTLSDHCVRFLTLTLRSNDATLSEQLDRCIACFRRLRSVPRIKKNMQGGVYFFEVTRSPTTNQWHPHLHVLFVGHYLPHALVKQHWHRITGDSYIVDIRGFPKADHAIGYVAKYVSKGIGCGIRPDSDGFAEAVVAFTGRRLFSTFGCLRGVKLSAVPEDDLEWEPVAPLWRILALAQGGCRSSQEILRQLRCYVAPPPADLLFDHEKESKPP